MLTFPGFQAVTVLAALLDETMKRQRRHDDEPCQQMINPWRSGARISLVSRLPFDIKKLGIAIFHGRWRWKMEILRQDRGRWAPRHTYYTPVRLARGGGVMPRPRDPPPFSVRKPTQTMFRRRLDVFFFFFSFFFLFSSGVCSSRSGS
jgi:hypothetical protein